MKQFKYLILFIIIVLIVTIVFTYYFGNPIGIIFLLGWAIFEYAIKAPPIIFFKSLGINAGHCHGYDFKLFEVTTLGWFLVGIWNLIAFMILFWLLKHICITFNLIKKK